MIAKEQGWVIAIDQASNCAGVSLWYNGVLKHTGELKSIRKTDTLSCRLIAQVEQLTAFLEEWIPRGDEIHTILFEGVRARLVLVTVGAFLTCPHLRNCKIHPKGSFVESTTWKYWAKRKGATGPVKDIKGVKALSEAGFPVEQFYIPSDDVADSILIYLAWRDRP